MSDTSESLSSEIWTRALAPVPDLVDAPEWPLGRSATYRAIRRGQVPTVTLAGTTYVQIPALREAIGQRAA